MSHELNDDFPPAEAGAPANWHRPPADAARSERAAGFGDSVTSRRRRRGGPTRTYAAILVLLAILVGGAYAAYVNGWLEDWIDLSGVTSLVSSGPAKTGIGAGKVVFAGNAHDLASPAGNLVQQDKADQSVAWIRSSLREADAAGATEGASLQIKPPLASDLVGKRIRLTISARAPDQGTPSPFAIAYSASAAGSSGWVVFTPTKEFDDYTFDYQVPATVGMEQYIGIWSDISGRGAPLAIRSIAIRPLN